EWGQLDRRADVEDRVRPFAGRVVAEDSERRALHRAGALALEDEERLAGAADDRAGGAALVDGDEARRRGTAVGDAGAVSVPAEDQDAGAVGGRRELDHGAGAKVVDAGLAAVDPPWGGGHRHVRGGNDGERRRHDRGALGGEDDAAAGSSVDGDLDVRGAREERVGGDRERGTTPALEGPR